MVHVCPWFVGYFLLNPLRKLVQDPARLLAPHVKSGMTVFEPGPGMGFFTLEIARLVGPQGRVYVSDIQEKMLQKLQERAGGAGLGERIIVRRADEKTFGVEDINGQVDFILSFAMTHEMPDVDVFFEQTSTLLKAGGKMLLVEPIGHVSQKFFTGEVASAQRHGLTPIEHPPIMLSHAVVLEKALGQR